MGDGITPRVTPLLGSATRHVRKGAGMLRWRSRGFFLAILSSAVHSRLQTDFLKSRGLRGQRMTYRVLGDSSVDKVVMPENTTLRHSKIVLWSLQVPTHKCMHIYTYTHPLFTHTHAWVPTQVHTWQTGDERTERAGNPTRRQRRKSCLGRGQG